MSKQIILDRSYSSSYSITYVLLTSRLNYCNALYVRLPLEASRTLQLVQNEAAWKLTGTHKYEHVVRAGLSVWSTRCDSEQDGCCSTPILYSLSTATAPPPFVPLCLFVAISLVPLLMGEKRQPPPRHKQAQSRANLQRNVTSLEINYVGGEVPKQAEATSGGHPA